MTKTSARAAAVFLAFGLFVVEGQQLPVPAPSPTVPGIVAPKQTAPPALPEIMPSSPVSLSGSPAKGQAATAGSPAPRGASRYDGGKTLVESLSPADIDQAVSLLKERFVDPDALGETEMRRATLQGLLDRLKPGALLLKNSDSAGRKAGPFRGEILDGRIVYLRLGAITSAQIGEMDMKLREGVEKGLKAAILDLRATPPGSEFEAAAELMDRFVPKGKLLFKVTKPSDREGKVFTASDDPLFQGLLVVLVDGSNAGAAEAIAAVLRAQAQAMVVGQKTKGEAVEFADLRLGGGEILRVATAEVTLPEDQTVYPAGVKPDLVVDAAPEVESQVLDGELDQGVSRFISDSDRPRMNEASLVAGVNPELDAIQAAQHAKERPKTTPRDAMLQRAVDLIAGISVYTKSPQAGR